MPDDVVTAIVKSSVVVEAYKDIVQPSARRVGYSLEALIKVATSPITILDWGYERSAEWLRKKNWRPPSRNPS